MKTIKIRMEAVIKSTKSKRLCRLLTILAVIYSIFAFNASTLTAGTATLSWSPPTTNADGSPITDLAGYKIYYGTASGNYSQSIDVGNVTTYTFSSLADGNTYYFSATAYNSSGSESALSNEASKTLSPGADVTPPVGTVTINGGAAYTASVSATLNISASDSSGVSQMCISNTATCTNWETYNNSKTWTLTSGAGVKTVFIWFKDTAGNANSTPYQASIALDTTAPTGSITINSGVVSTNTTAVSLTLSASDANGVSQMQFSNDTITWSAAETYAATKAWTLTAGDGTKTVYAKFKDNAGNWSQAYSDTISLATTKPVTTASPSGGIYSSTQSVTLNANKAATIYYTTNGSVPTTSSPVYTAPITISATTSLKFFAVDTLGNSESVKTETYTIDTASPAFSSTYPVSGSYINSTVIGYTLSKSVNSGKITFVRTGGALDATLHVYNFTNADKMAGTHNVNTGISLVNGAQYTVSFDATDLAGNVAATVSNKGITYDSTRASISVNNPASNSIVNDNIVSYNLSENIASGEIIYKWTGGTPDGLSPHSYPLSLGDRTAGSHSVNTGFTLINGAVYSIEIRNVTDVAGNVTSGTSNTNITYDSSSLAITNISPEESAIITDTTIRYNLNKAAISAKITFTRTGGEPDSSSPHVYTLAASDLYPGDHAIDTKFQLVDGAFYTVSFEAKDLTGKPATTFSKAMVFYDSNYVSTPVGNVDNTGLSRLRVDGSDLVKLSIAFGSAPGDPAWNPVCDLNKSDSSKNIIDGNDLITFGAHFGEVSK